MIGKDKPMDKSEQLLAPAKVLQEIHASSVARQTAVRRKLILFLGAAGCGLGWFIATALGAAAPIYAFIGAGAGVAVAALIASRAA